MDKSNMVSKISLKILQQNKEKRRKQTKAYMKQIEQTLL